MLTDKLKELDAVRAKLANLEQSVAAELNQELAGLPAKYGFGSADEFVNAVSTAVGGRAGRGNGRRRGRKPGAAKAAAPVAKAPAGPGRKRRKRAVITDKTRAEVKKLVKEGKTGSEIARRVGISLPSVQNIKQALGLVQKRKK